MMHRLVVFGLILVVTGCGAVPPTMSDSLAQQPQVLYVMPDNQWKISPQSSFFVQFSQPIDPTSLTPEGIFLIPGDESHGDFKNGREFEKYLTENKLGGNHPMSYKWLDDKHSSLLIQPQTPLVANQVYSMIVTTRIFSEEKFPLNQKPGESPVPYLKLYEVGEETTPITSPLENPDPIQPSQDPGEEGTGEDSMVETTKSPTSLKGLLIINELLYDANGSETDGEVFIELKGEPGLSLEGIKIVFINGSDGKVADTIVLDQEALAGDEGLFVVADLKTGSATETLFPLYHFLANFDPQNGPDCVQLFDGTGAMIDSLAYGVGSIVMAENGLVCGETSPAPDVPAGQSLSRQTGAQDTDNNASDFIANTPPSPGND